MIEQIDGAGLSGTLGKSGKKGKSSMFAKLFAVFDKRAEAAAKGKGLQIQGWQPNKGKALIAGLQNKDPHLAVDGKQLAVKGKQLISLDGKQSLIVPGKGKEKADTHDAVATAIQGIHQLASNQTKMKLGTGQSDGDENPVIALNQKTGKKSAAGQQSQGEKQVAAFADQKGDKQALLQNGSVKGEEGDISEGTASKSGKAAQPEFGQAMAQARQQAGASTSEGDVKAEASVATDKSGKDAGTEAKVVAGAKELKATAATAKSDAQTATLADTANRGVNQQSEAESTPVMNTARSEDPARQMGEREGSKKSDASPVANALQANAKQAHTPQVQQNSSATAAAAASVVANSAGQESLQGEMGQQGEEGSRDNRFVSSLSGDARTNQSQQTAGSTFQSYLQGKAPSMSLFDSMNHIAQSASNGKTKLEIQLEPASLGKIQVTLQTDASKQLQVHMVVDQGATRAAIEQQLPALRNALAQQGFDLSGFSMGSNGSQKEGFANNDGRGGNNRFNTVDQAGNANETMHANTSYTTRSADGGLSIRI